MLRSRPRSSQPGHYRSCASSLILISSLFVVLSFSCASAPAQDSGVAEASAAVRLLLPGELPNQETGYDADVNPYIVRKPMVGKVTEEFVVLKLDLSLPADSSVDILAAARDSADEVAARLFTPQELLSYWNSFTNNRSERQRRTRTVDYTYLPGPRFKAKGGATSYYLVLVGSYPIARPATVECAVLVDGKPVANFVEELYPLPKK